MKIRGEIQGRRMFGAISVSEHGQMDVEGVIEAGVPEERRNGRMLPAYACHRACHFENAQAIIVEFVECIHNDFSREVEIRSMVLPLKFMYSQSSKQLQRFRREVHYSEELIESICLVFEYPTRVYCNMYLADDDPAKSLREPMQVICVDGRNVSCGYKIPSLLRVQQKVSPADPPFKRLERLKTIEYLHMPH